MIKNYHVMFGIIMGLTLSLFVIFCAGCSSVFQKKPSGVSQHECINNILFERIDNDILVATNKLCLTIDKD